MLKIKLEKAKNNFLKNILHRVQKSDTVSDPLEKSGKSIISRKINMAVKNKKVQSKTKVKTNQKAAKATKNQAVSQKKSPIKAKSNVKIVAKANKNNKEVNAVKTAKTKNFVKKIVKVVAKISAKKPQKALNKKVQNQKAEKQKVQKAVKNTVKIAKKEVVKAKQLPQKAVQKQVEKNQDNKVVDIKSAIEKKKTFEQQTIEKKATEVVRKSSKNLSFKINDSAVYPSHGVGKIVDVENTNIGGQNFSCYLMYFETEKLTIKIPVSQAHRVGLRALSTKDQMEEVFTILRSGVKKLKGMWSRRAQEYEAKINSGDIIMLAEVLRDLTRDIEDGERSYSERIIYETAIYRLSAEYAAIYGLSFEEGREKVLAIAKDKLGSFDNKVKSKEDDFDFDDEVESSEEEEEDDLLEGEENDDYEDDDGDTGGKRSRG